MGFFKNIAMTAVALVLTLPGILAAQDNLQSLTGNVLQLPAEVAARLASQLPPELQPTEMNGAYILGYTGQDLPEALRQFLIQTISGLDVEELQPDRTVNISVALISSPSGTDVQLMMMGQTSQVSLLPAGAEILLTEGTPAACSGQMVVSHAGGVAENTETYVKWAKTADFNLTNASDASLSFFIGQRPACSIFIYIQPDPDTQSRSVIVVRYLED